MINRTRNRFFENKSRRDFNVDLYFENKKSNYRDDRPLMHSFFLSVDAALNACVMQHCRNLYMSDTRIFLYLLWLTITDGKRSLKDYHW